MSNWADSLWYQLTHDRPVISTSAPGKVLITGGYLVLDRRYSGLVVAVSARFRSRVSLLNPTDTCSDHKPQIILLAPQYCSQPLTASLDGTPILFSPRSNIFIEQTISHVIAVVQHQLPDKSAAALRSGFVIYTDADPVFYSEIGDDGVARSKSGLGSSAALVSSVTASLLALFGIDDLQIGYRIAQLAHCAAQGKVGSGFDISAAFFGSQIYRRFDEKISACYLNTDSLFDVLQDDKTWSPPPRPFSIPDGVNVVLGDVRLGSQTPVMVRSVLAWHQRQPADCWDNLDRLNNEFVAALDALRTFSIATLDAAAKVPHHQWEHTRPGSLLTQLRRTFLEIRCALRAMGVASGVEIEPAAQSSLLDVTMELNGVVCAGVPGAGGFDAIFAIYIGGNQTRDRIQTLWTEHNVTCVQVEQDYHGLIINKE